MRLLFALLILWPNYGQSQCVVSGPPNTSVCTGQAFLIQVSGASSYTWSVNSVIIQYGDEPSMNFPSELPIGLFNGPGIYDIHVTSDCQQSAGTYTVRITVHDCNVGINEYSDFSSPVYYNFNFQKVNPTPGQLLLKLENGLMKKVVLSDY